MHTVEQRIMLIAESGSFRDRHNQVFYFEGRVLRGLSQEASDNWKALITRGFFRKFVESGKVVPTWAVEIDDPLWEMFRSHGWSSVLEHERIPFISYPYEWTFSMLKDAALLHLELLQQSIEHDWSMKDATAYNVQWHGARPIFIDTTSFEPRAEGELWGGYRQFCMMFLIPLLLKSHLDIDYLQLLRSTLDGISPTEAVKFFRGWRRLKRGVMSHVVFPAAVEKRIAEAERGNAWAKKRSIHHSKTMLLGLLSGLERTVQALKMDSKRTAWSHYECNHSYNTAEFEEKNRFVENCVSARSWKLAWDLGCNTGTFSKLCGNYCDTVIAVDGDHNAVERLYLRERQARGRRILPLVMDLTNPSPNQGWIGAERKAFDQRARPDLIICLALIHHIVISANVPFRSFIDWLRGVGASVILEFVDRSDDMVRKLLMNKKEPHLDYKLDQFEAVVRDAFEVRHSQILKNGHRKLFYLEPK
jgi:hypothetical protein